MIFQLAPFELFVVIALASIAIATFVDPVYLWLSLLAFACLFSDSVLTVKKDQDTITISYWPPEKADKDDKHNNDKPVTTFKE